MIKKIILISSFCAITLFCGCKTNEVCTDQKPVAPNSYSSEKGNSSDPVFPETIFWWE